MKVLNLSQTHMTESLAMSGGISEERLMENAGAAAANIIKNEYDIVKKRVTVVAGGGNNGGDGYVIARKLKEYGAFVVIIFSSIPISKTAEYMKNRALSVNIPVLYYYDDAEYCSELIINSDFVIDSLFGIGFHGEPEKDIANIIDCLNKSNGKKIAVDLPSGIYCDSGSTAKTAFKADLTITFIGYKPCHFLFPAAGFCGKVVYSDIGISEKYYRDYSAETVEFDSVRHLLFSPSQNAHKGTKGKVAVIAGSLNMPGAARFCAEGAMRSGAGLVKIFSSDTVKNITAAAFPEAVYENICSDSGSFSLEKTDPCKINLFDSVVIGPGIGTDDETKEFVKTIIKNITKPLVLDADALNILSENTELLKEIKAPAVVTPHAGEMSRLTGKTIEEIENNRVFFASEFSKNYGVITVLKGAYTVIATPEGKTYINLTGNSVLATAGSGDILSGIIAGLAAGNNSLELSVVAGVSLHGKTGDIAADKYGKRGIIATDLLKLIITAFN